MRSLVSWKDLKKGCPVSVLVWACCRTLPVYDQGAQQTVGQTFFNHLTSVLLQMAKISLPVMQSIKLGARQLV